MSDEEDIIRKMSNTPMQIAMVAIIGVMAFFGVSGMDVFNWMTREIIHEKKQDGDILTNRTDAKGNAAAQKLYRERERAWMKSRMDQDAFGHAKIISVLPKKDREQARTDFRQHEQNVFNAFIEMQQHP